MAMLRRAATVLVAGVGDAAVGTALEPLEHARRLQMLPEMFKSYLQISPGSLKILL